VGKGVFKRRTSTKGVTCERAHLCEFGKNFVGSGRRLISKSHFCRGRFPFVKAILTLRSLRTRKGEKIGSCMSCITVNLTVNYHCHSPFSTHSSTRSLKKDSEVAGGGLGFHCENFGVLDM